MARNLVSPDSRLLLRPSSPSLSPDIRQRLSLNIQDSAPVFQDLLSRFQSCRSSTVQVLDWYKQSWHDLCEELRVLTDPSNCADLDYRTKGAGFEGMVTGMKRAVLQTESQVVKLCFKQRGKFSEAECKKGVQSAFGRMANDIWRQLGTFLQKAPATRVAETLNSLVRLQSEAESIASRLKELQVHFEEVLRRQANLSSLTPDARLHTSISVDDDEKLSEMSDLSRISSSAKDLSTDLKDQGNRLLKSFQRFASSGASDTGTSPARREMDLVLRDMLMMVRSSKAEVGRINEDKTDQRLERHLARIKSRIDSLCHSFEEGATTKRLTLSVSPPPGEALNVSNEDIRGLREVIERQATEIQQLRNQTLRAVSPIEPVHEELQQMNEAQGSIMADVREMRQHMDRVFFATKDTDSPVEQALLVLRASAPHIRTESDSEFAKTLMNEVLEIRKSKQTLLQMVNKDGPSLESLEEVGTELLRLRKEWQSLKEQHDELFLRMIKVQSEGELEINYLQSRVKDLEADLEAHKMGENTPKSSSSRTKKVAEIQPNSLDEENALLSSENFTLLQKLESAGKEKLQLLHMLESLKASLGDNSEPEIKGSLATVLDSLPAYPGRSSPFQLSKDSTRTKAHDSVQVLG